MVLFEVEVATEAFATSATRERLVFVVGVHVESEVAQLVEGLLTHLALELLFFGVCQTVVFVVSLLVEALAAELTHEGFVSLVDAEVGVEGGGAVEGLSTYPAPMRLL